MRMSPTPDREIHLSAGRCFALVYTRIAEPTALDHGLRLLGVVLANPQGPLPAGFDPGAAGTDWRVRYDHSPQGNLIAVRDRAGHVVRCFEWENHRLVAHGQPGGRMIRYVWDAPGPQGKVVEQIEDDGLHRRYHYHSDHTEVTDNPGRSERYEFSGDGPDRRWTAHQRADGSRIEHSYDGFGRRVSTTDPLGRKTYLRRDGEGRVVGISTPDGRTVSRRLDSQGQLLREEGPEGTTRYVRDALGRAIEITAADGNTQRFAYDDPALPDRATSITDPAGGIKQLGWNRLGQTTSYRDCSGSLSQWQYDADGQLVEAIDALDQRTRYRYDARGLQTGVELPDGSRVAQRFDPLGRLVEVRIGEALVRQNQWSPASQLIRSVDAAGRSLQFDYDRAGRLLTLINENDAQTRFAYDVCDRLIEQIGFDGRIQRYQYHPDDSLARSEDAGLTHHYRYDLAGRLIEQRIHRDEAAPPLLIEQLAWTATGQLASARSADSTVSFEYDASGRRIGELQQHGDGWGYRVQHKHHGDDRRLLSSYGDLPELDWRYYGPGHVQSLAFGDQQLEFERDPLHRETARHAWLQEGEQRRSAFTATRDYDALGRPLRHQLTGTQGERWQRDYRFDARGQLVGIDDSADADIRYRYDPTGRLVGSTHGEAEHNYRFDPAGNPLPATDKPTIEPTDWAATVQARLHDARFNLLGEGEVGDDVPVERWPDNRVRFDEQYHYRYDAAGNLVERLGADGDHMQLEYDARHRLARVQRRMADGERIEASYAYDALSRRIRKEVTRNGQVEITRYGWDGDHLVNEETATRQRTVIYEPGSFVPLLRIEQVRGEASDTGEDDQAASDQDNAAQLDDDDLRALRELLRASGSPLPPELDPGYDKASIHFFHTDHLGTPLRVTDTHGREIWRARNDDWGAVQDEHGDTDQPIRFQGQWEDVETGFYYNRYRYYDSAQGRYTTQDPIGLVGGWNLTKYTNNPIEWVDPLGLQARVCTRPLHGWGGFRTSGATGLDLGVFHEHIFYEDGTNIGYGRKGMFEEDSRDGYVCKNTEYDEEKMKQAVEIVTGQTTYFGLGKSPRWSESTYNVVIHNCQDFMSEVLSTYKKIGK
jgi:RHS repeat-associated protein